MRERIGISLVETIVALGLVSLVMILVVDLYPSAMATLRHAERDTVARNLAASILEGQLTRPFNSLHPGSQIYSPEFLEGVTYSSRVEIFQYQPGVVDSSHLMGVRVIVEWDYRASHRSILREALVHNLPP